MPFAFSTPMGRHHYVFDKLTAQTKVWEVMQDNEKLKAFPFRDIWRFGIDIEYQEFGPYIFENEARYMVGFLNALAFGLNLKEPNPQDYIEINSICGKGVFSDVLGKKSLSTYLSDRDFFSYGSFRIMKFAKIDPEGLEDLRQRANITLGLTSFEEKSNSGTMRIFPIPIQENFDNIAFLFAEHSRKILSSKNQGQRLIADLWLSRELELHHHFIDGNMRTSTILLLSLLANDPELPMMLLDTNPNLMDGSGPLPLVKRILAGMQNFSKTCTSQETLLSLEHVDAMTNISQKCFWRDYYREQWIGQKAPSRVEKTEMTYRLLFSNFVNQNFNKLMPLMLLIIITLSYKLINK